MKGFVLTFLLAAAACPLHAAAPPLPQPPAACLDYAHWDERQKGPPAEVRKYLDGLGRKGDLRALLLLAEGDFPCSSLAGGEYVRRADSARAIAFCTTLPVDSVRLRNALVGFRAHPRAKVIGYFKQLASSSCRELRYLCYEICTQEGWAGLEEAAGRDLDDREGVALPSQSFFGATLGDCAKRYLKRIKGAR